MFVAEVTDLISRGETSVVCALICNVKYDVSSSVLCVSYTRTNRLVASRCAPTGSLSSETSCAINFTLTFEVDTAADRTVHVVTSAAGQGVETKNEGTPDFLSIPGVRRTVWSTRNEIMDSLVTTCTYSNDTLARSHVKLEWMTPSAGGFVESEESFLTLRGVTDVFFQLTVQTSNRVEMDESDTVSQLNLTYNPVKEIVS